MSEQSIEVMAAGQRAATAAFDALEKIGVFLDELNALRLLDPDVAEPTNQLKSELLYFVERE